MKLQYNSESNSPLKVATTESNIKTTWLQINPKSRELPKSKETNCFLNCVVPENIHTPNMEGSSLRTPPPPPPPRIFHFFKKMVTHPLPSAFSTNTIRTPHPLWKVHFFGNKMFKNSKHKYSGCVLLCSVNIFLLSIEHKYMY